MSAKRAHCWCIDLIGCLWLNFPSVLIFACAVSVSGMFAQGESVFEAGCFGNRCVSEDAMEILAYVSGYHFNDSA